MRKFALLAALVGAIFFSLFGLSNRADAMTFSAPAGVLNAATEADAAQPEKVWWHRRWWGPAPLLLRLLAAGALLLFLLSLRLLLPLLGLRLAPLVVVT